MDLRTLLHRFSGGYIPAPPPVVGVLRLEGVIAASRRSGSLNIAQLGGTIDRLFELNRLVAVALVINSPGGSPAQSSLIYTRIRQRAAEHKVPVIAFAEDVAASGGYWLALAADEIWVQAGSLIGSIGVISAGFGFTRLIDRLGVDRRVYAAGEHKGMLDPFQPEEQSDIERLKLIHQDLHESFKELVKERRGARLLPEDEDVFTGTVFTGRQAVQRGLADGQGDVDSKMRERFGEKIRLRWVTPREKSWFGRLRPGLRERGMVNLLGSLLDRVEDRVVWGRFGL